jgi:hypothetical protein
MVDTTKIADGIDGLADRQIKAGGMKLTAGSILAIFAFLSTIGSGLYGGLLMWQKIEEVAGLDLQEYQTQMELMDANIQQTMDYTREIKTGLLNDILGIERQADRTEDMVREIEDKVREMIDKAELRFETQRNRISSTQDIEMKDLEDKLTKKLQRALDNPLAD